MNGADGHVRLRVVRQVAFRDLKLGQGALVITIAVIIGKTEREMALRKIWLQPQGFIGIETRFFAMRLCRLETVIQPTFHHRKSGESSCKFWIELDRLFEELLGLYRSVAETIWPVCVVMRL